MFVGKADLMRHISNVHEGNKPYKCEICDMMFSQKGNMKKHVKQSKTLENHKKYEKQFKNIN